jgi:hypothetical protein
LLGFLKNSEISDFFNNPANNPPLASNKTSTYPLLQYTLSWWPQVAPGPQKPFIEVGNVKSRFLEKSLHFSSSFIHIS